MQALASVMDLCLTYDETHEICFQETKLWRQKLTSDLAMAEGYESFFSYTRTSERGRSGYSGDIKCENVLVTSWNWLYLAERTVKKKLRCTGQGEAEAVPEPRAHRVGEFHVPCGYGLI